MKQETAGYGHAKCSLNLRAIRWKKQKRIWKGGSWEIGTGSESWPWARKLSLSLCSVNLSWHPGDRVPLPPIIDISFLAFAPHPHFSRFSRTCFLCLLCPFFILLSLCCDISSHSGYEFHLLPESLSSLFLVYLRCLTRDTLQLSSFETHDCSTALCYLCSICN